MGSAEGYARVFAEAAGVPLADAAAVGAKLASLLAQAATTWPKVTVAADAFVAHLGRHARGAPDPVGFLDAVHASDLYLAFAVARHDRPALAYFEEHFMAHVPAYVLRVRVERDVVEEIQQKLRERLILGAEAEGVTTGERTPKIGEYSGKGALGGWLRVAAVRTALNQVRAAAPAGAATREEPSVAADPELAYIKEHAADLFTDAFQRVLARLDPEERAVLRLHYIEGLTMDQLARLYKTPRSTIARRIAEVRQQILEATEALLSDEKRLSPSAIASVIRQARSRLQVTLTRLLE
jgi:RNA polymerase sigma-70 factor (ECF subfamily)